MVKIASGALPDFAALRQALAAQVAGADASTIIAAGSTACAPWRKRRWRPASPCSPSCSAVTVLSVTFATRGAMATNRPIVEVLHYVGATDGFIAGQFQRHFLLLGFKGGAIGGGAAIVLFGAAGSG